MIDVSLSMVPFRPTLWLLFLPTMLLPPAVMHIFHINPGISVLNEAGVCTCITVLTRVLVPRYVATVPQTTILGSDTLSIARNINRTTGNSA